MREKFELEASEELLWGQFIKYNKVKYFFLFLIGILCGAVIKIIIFLIAI